MTVCRHLRLFWVYLCRLLFLPPLLMGHLPAEVTKKPKAAHSWAIWLFNYCCIWHRQWQRPQLTRFPSTHTQTVCIYSHLVLHIIIIIIFLFFYLSFRFVRVCGPFRKRMRCTTNIYLTALAITDIAYLTLVLILSFKHYEYVKHHIELYYKLFGFLMWLCDACGKLTATILGNT